MQHGCTFLVAMEAGRDALLLGDVRVEDADSGATFRAATAGPPLPEGGHHYQIVPWTRVRSADSMKNRPEEHEVRRRPSPALGCCTTAVARGCASLTPAPPRSQALRFQPSAFMNT